jgi:5'-nucleotidase
MLLLTEEYNMQNRRQFIKNTTLAALALSATGGWNDLLCKPNYIKLTILHTNDMHSRIDPFPADDKKFGGRGGMAARAALVKKIKATEKNVLLLDSGDIFQGTPYFNFFGGELELKLMSQMGYDAATLGNHDFDAGLEGLEKQLPHATFPFLCANYNFDDTILHGKIQKHKIFHFDNLKVGVFGIGIELQGLVPKKLYGNVRYHEPVIIANETAAFLKHDMKCHYVIVLSHLGYKYEYNKVSDVILAENTENIDVILGGHTHTFMQQPHIAKNKKGNPVIINQVGWAGLMLGRLDIIFDEKYKQKQQNFFVEKI